MALDTLFSVIRDARTWPGYGRAQEVAETARVVFAETSEGQRSIIGNIRKSETADQLETRLRVSHPTSGPALAGALSFQSKIPRAPDRVALFMHRAPKVQEDISAQFEVFYGRQDLYGYLFEYSAWAQNFDPGAWLLLEKRAEDNRLYPVEVSSEEAVWHAVDEAGALEWFVFRRNENTPKGDPRRRWYLYGADYAAEAVEVTKAAPGSEGWPQTMLEGKAGKITVAYMEYPGLALPQVPAIPMGAYRDAMHRENFELFYQRAVPVLRQLMVVGNTSQVTDIAHGFPKLYRYVGECKHINAQGDVCQSGYYGGVREKDYMCPQCKGKGSITQTSELDVVDMILPNDAGNADMIDLSRLQHSIRPPIEGMAYMNEKVQELMRLVTALVFNQDTTGRVEMATATAVNSAVDSITNKLRDMAEQIENAWEMCHVIAMGYLGADPAQGEASLTHPADFEIEPMGMVVADYSAAKAAGLPAPALDPLLRRILNRMYRNDPRRVAEALALEEWRPLRGKTDALAAMIVAGLDPLDTTRLLWEHFDRVVEEVRALLPAGRMFQEFARTAQGNFISSAVEVIRQDLRPLAPAPPDPFALLGADGLEPEPGEEEEQE